jgi:hypothetical protein
MAPVSFVQSWRIFSRTLDGRLVITGGAIIVAGAALWVYAAFRAYQTSMACSHSCQSFSSYVPIGFGVYFVGVAVLLGGAALWAYRAPSRRSRPAKPG